MTWLMRTAAVVLLTGGFTAAAFADEWNDRTTLKFSEPVMIPGATLAPGTYVFKLLDLKANRHMVQIMNEDETKLIATSHAVPIRRKESRDVVVKMNPTEAGAPVALKAWFYPDSLYGHQLVYPDKQARQIAERTKTLVLSTDITDGDFEKGTLYTYDAEGRRGEWQEDATTIKEWKAWREGRARTATAKVARPGRDESRESTAPAVRSQSEGMKVPISDLEDKGIQYIGKTINVTAEVEEVFGPRLFKIDEPNWADLDGEVLVYLPSNLAALVREEDRVTVTGTMKAFLRGDIERELGWLEQDPDLELEFAERPILVASTIVGGDNNRALAIDVNTRRSGTNKPVGTSGAASATGAPITDADALARSGSDIVGREVDLEDVKVSRIAKNHGFWVEAGQRSVFILPADQQKTTARTGQTLSIEGLVLEMPRSLRDRTRAAGNANEAIYVYATSVK